MAGPGMRSPRSRLLSKVRYELDPIGAPLRQRGPVSEVSRVKRNYSKRFTSIATAGQFPQPRWTVRQPLKLTVSGPPATFRQMFVRIPLNRLPSARPTSPICVLLAAPSTRDGWLLLTAKRNPVTRRSKRGNDWVLRATADAEPLTIKTHPQCRRLRDSKPGSIKGFRLAS